MSKHPKYAPPPDIPYKPAIEHPVPPDIDALLRAGWTPCVGEGQRLTFVDPILANTREGYTIEDAYRILLERSALTNPL